MSLEAERYGFQLIEPGQELERCRLAKIEPQPLEVVIEVAGCGVCHTDVGFAIEGIPTRAPLPLILGHEISGRVIAAGREASDWEGRAVIVPSVIPCGRCPACERGRSGICRNQFMPGNHGNGGFATHVCVPAKGLCAVPEELPEGLSLAHLSVIADAVTTPFEAIRRAELTAGEVSVFVGAGGVGGFGVQIAAALGSRVVAIDVDAERLALAEKYGAALTLNAATLEWRELKSAVRSFVKENGPEGIGPKVFETSGTVPGQATAFGLLGPGSYLAVVGYTPHKIELQLSKLMAFDATAQGNWGCPPEHYPAALDLVLAGQVALPPFVEMHPLDSAPAVLRAVADHKLHRRAILVPESS